MNKKQLDEIYSRPEKQPFERLNALMEFAMQEITSTTKPITFTMKENVIAMGKLKAKTDNRSFSNYIESLILKDNSNV